MVAFQPASVYGNRVAFQEILLVTAQESRNIFHRCPAWRQGLIPEVTMLGRADMVKPPRGDDARFGNGSRFTKVQEMKQDLVPKIIWLFLTWASNLLRVRQLQTCQGNPGKLIEVLVWLWSSRYFYDFLSLFPVLRWHFLYRQDCWQLAAKYWDAAGLDWSVWLWWMGRLLRHFAICSRTLGPSLGIFLP